MNASSWKKAADIVTKMTPVSPQASATAMVELQNLQSLPLSALSIDEQFNTAIDDTSDDPMIIMGKPLTTAFISENVHIPTDKVGCLQVTNQLREFIFHQNLKRKLSNRYTRYCKY